MFRVTEWPYLAEHQPDEAKKRMRAAMNQSDGNVTAMGRALGLTRQQLYKYLRRLELTTEVEKAREVAG